ncbi:MAG: PTS sugar transporter subunit IIA [Proteobacteria bacterium]|jgi:mannose/fructose/sorbose-specific phosphotransferase system IIA component|nr:PTS sugar transporter subunit IIA [Pseudomonadota bacterium]
MSAGAPIGVVICCHGEMAAGLRSAAEMIVGPQEGLAVVGVRPADGREDVEASLATAATMVDRGAGVLVLTDLPGGTPCVEAARRRGASYEMIAGVNLPALVEVLMGRADAPDVHALAEVAAEIGRRHVASGRELFGPQKGGL